MRLNDKITVRLEETVAFSKQVLLSIITNKKQKWSTPRRHKSINFNEINIIDDRIEILSSPSTFNAFKPKGKITLELENSINNQTVVKCKIFPYNGSLTAIITILILVLTLFTTIVFFITLNFISIILTLALWPFFGLALYLHYVLTKKGLIYYTKNILEELNGKF